MPVAVQHLVDNMEGLPKLFAFAWLTSLLLLAVWTIKLARNLKRVQSKLLSIPGPPSPRGILGMVLGNTLDLINNGATQQVSAWSKVYGNVYKIRLVNRWYVITSDPTIYGKTLKQGPLRLPKDLMGYRGLEMFTRPYLPNIATSPDSSEYWMSMRKAVAPGFSMSNLRHIFPDVVLVVRKVVDGLRSQDPAQPVNMDDWAQKLTVDIIGKFLFDRDLKAVEGDQLQVTEAVAHCFQGAHDILLNNWKSMLPWAKEARRFRKWTAEYDQVVTTLVDEAWARTADSSQPLPPHSLMTRLLSWRDPRTGKGLTGGQIKAEIGILLIAGFETTAHTIAWTLLLLAQHPVIEARVVEELDSLGLLVKPGQTSYAREVTWEDLSQLHYLTACINESMRILPVAPGLINRVVDRDVTLGALTLPKGTYLGVPIMAVHHNDANWPSSWQFDPNRWMRKDLKNGTDAPAGEDLPHVQAFLPFSDGPRNCVGQSLALMELKVVLASLYGHFTFKMVDEFGDVQSMLSRAVYAVTLKPSGMKLKCFSRATVGRVGEGD